MKIINTLISLITVFLVGLIFSTTIQAQNIPVDIRNFLIKFNKVSSLSEFDNNELISNKYSASAALQFIGCFDSENAVIYNDIVQQTGYPMYLRLNRYAKIVDSLYPRGYFVNIQNPVIRKVKKLPKYNLYVVEVEKQQRIDSYVEDPPIALFNSPVRLLLYIADYHGTDDIKILTIEPKGSAFRNLSLFDRLSPDGIGIYGHYNSYSLTFNELPEQYDGLSQSGHLTGFGFNLDWNLGGKGNINYGLSSGLNFQSFSSEIKLEQYSESFFEFDKDGKYYQKNIMGRGIIQEEKLSHISLPVLFKINYSLGHRWDRNKVNKDKPGSLPYRKGISLSFAAGPVLRFPVSSSNVAIEGVYSYNGLYRFLSDSIPVLISDLPEYGFYNDTSFANDFSETDYTGFSAGINAQLTVNLPISKSLDFYLGPRVFYELTSFANKEDNFILSTALGNAKPVSHSAKSKAFSYGVVAGLSLNINNIRNPYSKFEKPSFKQTGVYKKQYQMAKSSLVKKQIGIILYPEGYNTSKTKVEYSITADWQKKDLEGKLIPGKRKDITYQKPGNVGSINLKGNLIISKPFGFDITSNSGVVYDDVNSQTIEIGISELDEYTQSSNLLEFTINELPEFSFVYVSLYNPRETKEQRSVIVDKVRQLGNEAIYNNRELVVYVSTEINQPKVFTNIVIEGIEANPNFYNDWDQFLRLMENEWNSRDLEYNEDLQNLDNILEPILKLSERMNANRRYVDYSFVVNQAERYFGISSDEPSEMHKLILYLTNKFCDNVPYNAKQYSLYVYVNEKTNNPQITNRDINTTIETQNEIFNEK